MFGGWGGLGVGGLGSRVWGQGFEFWQGIRGQDQGLPKCSILSHIKLAHAPLVKIVLYVAASPHWGGSKYRPQSIVITKRTPKNVSLSPIFGTPPSPCCAFVLFCQPRSTGTAEWWSLSPTQRKLVPLK